MKKKLRLKGETIRQLSARHLQFVAGGEAGSFISDAESDKIAPACCHVIPTHDPEVSDCGGP